MNTPKTFSVDRVGAKIWALRLPAPTIFFSHVYAYLIDTGAGLVLIDAGDATETGWQGLRDAIAEAGFAVSDIAAVLLTHSHYDHCGNAARIRDLSGAWIGLTAAEDKFLRDYPRESDTRAKVRALCLEAGAEAAKLPAGAGDLTEVEPIIGGRHLQPNERITLGDVSLTVLPSPGHSPGHTSFMLDAENLLFCGDFLLPQGQPLVLLMDAGNQDADPLGDYLAALRRPELAQIRRALPGHLGPIENLAERIEEERSRIEKRLDQLAAGLNATPVSPAELVMRNRAGKSGEMAPGAYQLNILNMITSLRALEKRGQAVAQGGLRYCAGR